MLSGSFETTFFMVGDKRFPALPLNEKFLREALQEAGFIIKKLEKVARAAETHLDNRSDYTGLFFLVCMYVFVCRSWQSRWATSIHGTTTRVVSEVDSQRLVKTSSQDLPASRWTQRLSANTPCRVSSKYPLECAA